MADEADWLPDLAALASLSVAVHYVLGFYGLLGALLIFTVLEHGAKLRGRAWNVSGRRPLLRTTRPPKETTKSRRTKSNRTGAGRGDAAPPARSQPRSERVGSGAPREDMEMNSPLQGHALFLVRTQPEDPHYAALFAGKRRMFWIQIAPGVFTRSVALVIMGLIRRLVGRVSFSFGSSTDSENSDELPAVAFPLYQSVDQFVETQEGQDPPVLGTGDFGESEQLRRQRRHTSLGAEKYAVGPTWETANLPGGLNAMDLASFFDSLPLRLVAYQVKSSEIEISDSHRQRDKDYLFSFEVKYDKHSRLNDEEMREDVGRGSGSGRASTVSGTGLSLMGSEMSTMSTTLSDASSLTEEDPVLAQEQAVFLRLEHARRLGQLSFSYLCWMEEVDVASDVRRVHYVFAVKDKVGEYDEGEIDADDELTKPQHRYRLAIVSSYELRNLLQGRHALKSDKTTEELAKLRFHSRSRIGSYSTISTEAQQVVMHLQRLADEPLPQSTLRRTPVIALVTPRQTKTLDENRLIAAQAALYKCLMKRQRLQESFMPSTKLSPSRIGVNLSRRDRGDMGVVFEGVVYRYYAAELLRQEVLLLTKRALLFYRSYASSAEKQVSCSDIIGARAVEVPSGAAYRDGASGTDGAFALQISTFAEEIVLCVGTSSTRDAWVRGILQYCNPKTNFDRAQQGEMYIGFAAGTALRPANRVELNSRLLFPQLKQQDVDQTGVEMIPVDTVPGALKLVKRTLTRALHILNNAQQLSVTDVLAFLDDASTLRAVDLKLLQDSGHTKSKLLST
ncbi:Pleckstrin homology domain [Phytophthora cactorum]|nr:Pleckstrin homology domain [Phytophthora cactorum]